MRHDTGKCFGMVLLQDNNKSKVSTPVTPSLSNPLDEFQCVGLLSSRPCTWVRTTDVSVLERFRLQRDRRERSNLSFTPLHPGPFGGRVGRTDGRPRWQRLEKGDRNEQTEKGTTRMKEVGLFRTDECKVRRSTHGRSQEGRELIRSNRTGYV